MLKMRRGLRDKGGVILKNTVFGMGWNLAKPMVYKVSMAATSIHSCRQGKQSLSFTGAPVVVVALLFYVHGKHLRSCRDGRSPSSSVG